MKMSEANSGDISLIQELAEKSWRHFYREILSEDQIDYMLNEMYGTEELRKHFSQQHYHYFLIEKNGKSLGFIGFEHNYEQETTKLHRIYLLKEAQGTGLGKAALSFLKEKTAESGNRRIILNVNKDNPSKKFYESQGFSVYEEGVFDIGNGFVMDDFLMECFV